MLRDISLFRTSLSTHTGFYLPKFAPQRANKVNKYRFFSLKKGHCFINCMPESIGELIFKKKPLSYILNLLSLCYGQPIWWPILKQHYFACFKTKNVYSKSNNTFYKKYAVWIVKKPTYNDVLQLWHYLRLIIWSLIYCASLIEKTNT